jgi:hypothetical protein
MFTISHNLKNNKDGFAILAALVIVVIFSIAISQWITTDSVTSKFKIAPVIYAKHLAQAQQINHLIGSSADTFDTFKSQASFDQCSRESSACSRYINATQNALCTPTPTAGKAYAQAIASQNSSTNNKKIFTLVWCDDCLSPSQIQITTCVSDISGENIALSVWRLTQKNNSLKLVQEEEF